MNLPPRLGQALSSAGHAVDHWSSVGPADATDAQILHYAVQAAAVVLTHDLDFGTILAASDDTVPSVIIIRSDNLAEPELTRAIIAPWGSSTTICLKERSW